MSENTGGTQRPNVHNVFLSPTVVAAIVTAVATIVAVALGSLLTVRAIRETKPETYELTVSSTKYPFEKTPVEVHEGDEIEIVVLGANSTVLNCGLGDTTVIGMINDQNQPSAVLSTSNLCSFIGRIGPESAPHFPVGAYTKFVADISGSLSLGVNDVITEKCSPMEDCFSDNAGKVYVRVAIVRR